MATYAKFQLNIPQFQNASGLLVGGTIHSYVHGTSTDLAMYTSDAGDGSAYSFSLNTSAKPNVSGTQVDIYGLVGQIYDFVVKDANGTTVDTIGPCYPGGLQNSQTFATLEELRTSSIDNYTVIVTRAVSGGRVVNMELYKDGTGTASTSGGMFRDLATNAFCNASGVCYKLKVIQVITPFHFGAYGDGSTTGKDAPATDNAVLFRHTVGGGIVFCPDPDSSYLLDTVTDQTSNPYYVYLYDDVTVYCESRKTIFKVANGQNAAHAGTTGPNVFATDKTTPIQNFHFRNGKVDWNGANNLLSSSDTARNNAAILSVYGGIDCSVDNLWVYETPGNQCVFFPMQSDQGQRNIRVSNSRFENGGSGLSGNYNIDHSSVYCGGDGLLYENNYFVAPDALQVSGACYELHGNGIARGNKSWNYTRSCWISANKMAIAEIVLDGEYHKNCTFAWALANDTNGIGRVTVSNSNFIQKSGLTGLTASNYFIGGYTAGCDELNIINCKHKGQGYDNSFLQYYKIKRFSMVGGSIENFPNSSGYGIQSTNTDLGDGYVSHQFTFMHVYCLDVAHPVYFNSASLKAGGWQVCHNTFDLSAAIANYVVTTSFTSSEGFQHSNIINSSYTGGYTGTPNGILTNSLT